MPYSLAENACFILLHILGYYTAMKHCCFHVVNLSTSPPGAAAALPAPVLTSMSVPGVSSAIRQGSGSANQVMSRSEYSTWTPPSRNTAATSRTFRGCRASRIDEGGTNGCKMRIEGGFGSGGRGRVSGIVGKYQHQERKRHFVDEIPTN